jgi:hypothetical protein
MSIITSINQSTFIKGRFILESVVTAHETLNSMIQSKSKGIVIKLEYEKPLTWLIWTFFRPKALAWIIPRNFHVELF